MKKWIVIKKMHIFANNHLCNYCNYTKTIIIHLRLSEYQWIKTLTLSRFLLLIFTLPLANNNCFFFF